MESFKWIPGIICLTSLWSIFFSELDSNDLINSVGVTVPSEFTVIFLSNAKADLVNSLIDDWSISSCSL